jgi:hypothetical protein
LIIDSLLSFLSDLVTGFLENLPPLPDVFSDSLSYVSDAGSYLGGIMSPFGFIVPWSSFYIALGLWVLAFGYFVSLAIARFLLGLFVK